MSPQTEPKKAPRARILVAEDEATIRTIFERHLTGAGFEVVLASDGKRALDKLEQDSRFDLVVTDLNMPELDGEELLRAIKAKRPDLPVIVVTAVRDSDAISRAFLNDAYRYLKKPFTQKELIGTVESALHDVKVTNRDVARTRMEERDGWIMLTAPSKQEYLDRFQDFCDMLLSSRLDEKARNELKIAVQELGQNAIEWGNKLSNDNQIKVAWKLLPDRIQIRIEDQGAGFDPSTIPDPTIDPIAIIEQREKVGKRPGGFGIHLARRVMDHVAYNERGNVVLMEKRFS